MEVTHNPVAFTQDLVTLADDLDGMIADLERLMGAPAGLLTEPLVPEMDQGQILSPEAATRAVTGDNMPNPLANSLPESPVTQQVAETALAGGDANAPTSLGKILAELRDMGEISPQAMMAVLLGNALGVIDEQGFFGEGGLLEAAAVEPAQNEGGGFLGGIGDAIGGIGGAVGGLFGGGDDGGGFLGGIGNAIGGIFGGGGGGLLGGVAGAIGGIFGEDVGDIAGGVIGTVANFASGNFIGGAMAAIDTIGELTDDGDNQTLDTLGGILDVFQQNFGTAIETTT